MNLLLLEEGDFTQEGHDTVKICGRRFMHLKKVLRATPGDRICCGLLNARMGDGEVVSMDRDSATLKVILDREPPPGLPLTLVLALPRPKMLKRTLQSISSLGVKEIYLVNSWRVEKSFWKADLLTDESLCSHLKLGLEQARDTRLPHIYLRRYFTDFVQNELCRLGEGKKRILAHPKTSQACPVGVNKDTVLVIGPEGGFIDLEVETLCRAGFDPVHMGPRILRVETAVPALISRLFTL